MALITVKTFDNSIDAYLLKSKLESEGIVCYLFDEHTVSVNPLYNVTVGGIKLKINEADLEKAQQVYAEIQASPYTDDKGNAIQCPNCQSIDLFTGYDARKGVKGFFSTLGALLLTFVPAYSKKMYKCKKCGTAFKHPVPPENKAGNSVD
ncbi:MAG: DUF2007 domain-containing protein [Bacteroidetes bacterium]|nr:DUF2007 domain-containing protein [Bacteroidota bacterium]